MPHPRTGFSLLELLLALALGVTLVAVIGEALLREVRQSGQLARLLHERIVTQRALELMRLELQEASAVRVMPGAMTREGCGLAGRTVLLHLDFTPDGVLPDRDVTYSLERKPDPIWRGQALMRCGPAYSLGGQMEQTASVSRVWLDALRADGSSISLDLNPGLRLSITRSFSRSGRDQQFITEHLMVPGNSLI